jgi:hypothetical protein
LTQLDSGQPAFQALHGDHSRIRISKEEDRIKKREENCDTPNVTIESKIFKNFEERRATSTRSPAGKSRTLTLDYSYKSENTKKLKRKHQYFSTRALRSSKKLQESRLVHHLVR